MTKLEFEGPAHIHPGWCGIVLDPQGDHPGEWDGMEGIVYDRLPSGSHPFMVSLGRHAIQCSVFEIQPSHA